jgi:hypothetical protein
MEGFNTQTTAGVLLKGVAMANLLFGISTVQVCVYYQTFPRDRWSLKILVRDELPYVYLCTKIVPSLRGRLLLYGALKTMFRLSFCLLILLQDF